jgi:hypothetical protein
MDVVVPILIAWRIFADFFTEEGGLLTSRAAPNLWGTSSAPRGTTSHGPRAKRAAERRLYGDRHRWYYRVPIQLLSDPQPPRQISSLLEGRDRPGQAATPTPGFARRSTRATAYCGRRNDNSLRVGKS